MWFYANEDECKLTTELIEIFKNSVKFFDVKKIINHKIENGDLYVLIWWKRKYWEVTRSKGLKHMLGRKEWV